VPRSNSGFIHSVNGTYCLDRQVYVDLDEFDALVSTGLETSAETRAGRSQAISYLDRAMDLYRGDLFAEEPFAEWAFEERETMRTLACHALEALVEHHLASRELAAATRNLERYASLQPLDSDVHQTLIRTYLEQGHRSEAQRRYAAFRRRLIHEFGEEPEFRLSDITV
jgi:DNA-binding SARP family transcriptional activator